MVTDAYFWSIFRIFASRQSKPLSNMAKNRDFQHNKNEYGTKETIAEGCLQSGWHLRV